MKNCVRFGFGLSSPLLGTIHYLMLPLDSPVLVVFSIAINLSWYSRRL